jgi:hypothetical protein
VSWGGAGKNRNLNYIDERISISYDEAAMPLGYILNQRTGKNQHFKDLSGDSLMSPLQYELTEFAESIREERTDSEKLKIGLNVVSILKSVDESLEQGHIWRDVSYETD